MHWSRISERGGVFGLRLMVALRRVLGRRVTGYVLLPVVWYFYVTSSRARAASRNYLRRVAAARSAAGSFQSEKLRTLRHFNSFADSIVDKIDMWSGIFDPGTIEIGHSDVYDEIRRLKTGACFIGSHLGNIELLRALGGFEKDIVVNALIYTRHSPAFRRVLEEIDPDVFAGTIQVDSTGPETIMMLQDRCARGEHVAIVGDRTSVRHEQRSVTVRFLGSPAKFPEGPFVLAHLLRCPVYLIVCLKLDGRHRMFIERFANPLSLSRAARREELQRWVQQYADRLQHYCLMAPLQWFNFFDFWEDEIPRP